MSIYLGELQEEQHDGARDPPGDPQGGDQHHDGEKGKGITKKKKTEMSS